MHLDFPLYTTEQFPLYTVAIHSVWITSGFMMVERDKMKQLTCSLRSSVSSSSLDIPNRKQWLTTRPSTETSLPHVLRIVSRASLLWGETGIIRTKNGLSCRHLFSSSNIKWYWCGYATKYFDVEGSAGEICASRGDWDFLSVALQQSRIYLCFFLGNLSV